MDSAYKNQILSIISKTIGNNKNPTKQNRNTIFLLVQFICDTIEKYENTISKLDTLIDKLNNTITDKNALKVDIEYIDNLDISYINKNDGLEYGEVRQSIYNSNL